MFGFEIGTAYEITLGLMNYLLVSFEISRNNKLDGLLDRISLNCNFTWKT